MSDLSLLHDVVPADALRCRVRAVAPIVRASLATLRPDRAVLHRSFVPVGRYEQPQVRPSSYEVISSGVVRPRREPTQGDARAGDADAGTYENDQGQRIRLSARHTSGR